MPVRVIRILEYVYPSHERAEQDMQRWAVGANSVQRHGDMTISSATMAPRTVGPDEQTLGEAQDQQFCKKTVRVYDADRVCGAELVNDVCPRMHMHVGREL